MVKIKKQGQELSFIINTEEYWKRQMEKETNLNPFILHVWAAEHVVNVFFGHGLQELTHLLLPLKSSSPSRYHRIIWNQQKLFEYIWSKCISFIIYLPSRTIKDHRLLIYGKLRHLRHKESTPHTSWRRLHLIIFGKFWLWSIYNQEEEQPSTDQWRLSWAHIPVSFGASAFCLGFLAFLAGDWEFPCDVCWLWHSSAERVPTILATFAQYPATCLG